MQAERSAKSPRFLFLDGLRGVAALAVLLHHLYHGSEYEQPLLAVFPHWLTWLCNFGSRGVEIFFVLSGFVIAYSLRETIITSASAANFALRRQVRLDPAYWVCLCLGVGDSIARAHAHAALVIPTVPAFLANMFYLQGILNQPVYLNVSWTLCLEVQFYLVLLLTLAIVQHLPLVAQCAGTIVLVMGLGLVSLYVRGRVGGDYNPWFINNWYLFAAGAMAYWSLDLQMNRKLFWLFICAIAAAGVYHLQDQMIVGAVTVAIIYLAGRTGNLTNWLSNPVIQYFGRISYSLYLVHLLILARVYKIGMHVSTLSHGAAITWFIVAAGCSILAADLLHRLVERPTMRLASRLKRGGADIRPDTSDVLPPIVDKLPLARA